METVEGNCGGADMVLGRPCWRAGVYIGKCPKNMFMKTLTAESELKECKALVC